MEAGRYKHFVFGEEAVRTLMEEGEEVLLEDIEKECMGYGTFQWDDRNSTPEDLLQAVEGYTNYAFISEELYNKICR